MCVKEEGKKPVERNVEKRITEGIVRAGIKGTRLTIKPIT